MQELLYPMIFKRQSFHTLRHSEPLTTQELQEIQSQLDSLVPLVADIRTECRIVPSKQVPCRKGEYCVLFYSEPKENALANIGYMGEQLDLWLASRNIGACWYGMGKPDQSQCNGLDYIIMLFIGKSEASSFRKDYTKAARRPLGEIWHGDRYLSVAEVVRYAPSACNSQPWLVEFTEQTLTVNRVKGKSGIMPQAMVARYNPIDIGIFLLILELCMEHEGLLFQRELLPEPVTEQGSTPTAVYTLR